MAEETVRAAPRTVLATVLFAAGLSWTAGNVGPVVDDLARDFDVSLATIGVLTGTIYFGAVVAITPIAAPLTRRLGVVDAMRLACVLGAIGNLTFAVTPIYGGLVLGQVLQGFGVGLCLIVGPVFARTEGGLRLLGIYGASISLGIAIALAVCSVLQDLGAVWRVGFVISAVISAAALPFFPGKEMGARTEAANSVADGATGGPGFLSRAIRTPEMWRLLPLFTATLGVPLVVSVWLVHYLGENGVQTWVAGALGFLLFGVAVISRPGGARLVRSGVPVWVMLGVAPVLAAAGLAAIALEPSVAVALPAVLLIGAGASLPYAPMFNTAQGLFPHHRPGTIAFLTMGPNAAPIIVIPLVGAALAAGNGETAFLLLGAFVLAAGLLNLRPPTRSARARGDP